MASTHTAVDLMSLHTIGKEGIILFAGMYKNVCMVLLVN